MSADDKVNQESFDAEPEGLREAHRAAHDALADADPTGQEGKPFLVTGFIGLIVLALLALVIVAVVIL